MRSEHLLALSDKSTVAFMQSAVPTAAENRAWQHCRGRSESRRRQGSAGGADSHLHHLELVCEVEGRTCNMGRSGVTYIQLAHA